MPDGIRITVADVQAWLETTKLTITTIDPALDLQVETQILAQLEAGFNVTAWTNSGTTPEIIRTIMAMEYASLLYDKQYSEDSDQTNPWAARLDLMANDLLQGTLTGSVTVDGYIAVSDHSGPDFYPTDSSSIPDPNFFLNRQYGEGNNLLFGGGDASIGPAKFSMNLRF